MATYALLLEHTLPIQISAKGFLAGIEDFIRFPEHYIDALEHSEVLEETALGNAKTFRRKLDYGTFSFEETVTLTEKYEFIERVPSLGEAGSSLFKIQFKSLSDASAEVVFTYRGSSEQKLPAAIAKLREAAWIAKDKQFVEKIQKQFGNIGSSS